MHVENVQTHSRRSRTRSRRAADAGIGAFMGSVYAWMAAGLALSSTVAYGLSTQPELLASLFSGASGWVLVLVPFGLIFLLGSRVEKASLAECAVLFFFLTGIMGTWLTGIAVQATQNPAFATAVYETLGVTVAMFAGMSLTGWITRRDLSGMGNFFVAALWGLIAVGLLNFYLLQSAGLDFAYHIVAVVVFAGLTAYDTQALKEGYRRHGGGQGRAIWGALTLYLDFLNLFLHLLRFMGVSSDD